MGRNVAEIFVEILHTVLKVQYPKLGAWPELLRMMDLDKRFNYLHIEGNVMFGWEFHRIISGGLGTACYGLVKGMVHSTIRKVNFVVPNSGEMKNLWLILSNASIFSIDYP